MATLSRNLKLNINEIHTHIKTKIVCTIGLKTSTKEAIGRLVEEGMNVLRLNFSHGTHESHKIVINNLREYLSENPGRACSIMLDTKGPEIRTGKLVNKTIRLNMGDLVNVTCDTSLVGHDKLIVVDYQHLCTSIKPDMQILLSDGLIGLTVKEMIDEKTLVAVVNNNAILGERKNVHLPGAEVDLPAVSEQDIKDIKFGADNDVDFIAASFIRRKDDVEEIRELLGEKKNQIMIISKIESEEGVNNFDAILRVSDGIMVARGDLGVELAMEKIFVAQKMMVSKCNAANKPVITATQMLESMITNPRPTRAECTDVANAVLDGTDCVMLSGETASGDYPFEAVRIMVKICRQAEAVEASMDNESFWDALRKASKANFSIAESVASSTVRTAIDVGADLIITVTETGNTARLVSKYRPPFPIICATPRMETFRHLNVTRGAYPIYIPPVGQDGTDKTIGFVLESCLKRGLCKVSSRIVLLSGVMEGIPGKTNMVRVLTVSENVHDLSIYS